MKFLLLCLAVAAVVSGNPIDEPGLNPFTPNGRIVGGRPATIEEFPYQVGLLRKGSKSSFCGGSIISSKYVLTAGHCIIYSASSTVVRTGATSQQSGGTLHGVSRIIKHENYKTNQYGIPVNDIALLELADPIRFDKSRKAISLYKSGENVQSGLAAVLSGWGATKEGGSVSPTLQTVSVPVISKDACKNAYNSYGGLPAGQICAAYPQGGKDTCQGDSGGPMVVGGRQAGVVSWGNGCARPNYPGVYTEVAYFRNWIKQKSGV